MSKSSPKPVSDSKGDNDAGTVTDPKPPAEPVAIRVKSFDMISVLNNLSIVNTAHALPVLVHLDTTNNATVEELTAALGLNRAGLNKTLPILSASGMVSRASSGNRREQVYSLTESGRSRLERMILALS